MGTRQSPACASAVTADIIDHRNAAGRCPPHGRRHRHPDGGGVAAELSAEERRRFLVPAGVVLAIGWLLEGSLGQPVLAEMAFYISMALAMWTFSPEILEERLSVATLMALGAIGAAILKAAHDGALLAFLFGVSEAVMHQAFDRTRSGLRNLLQLVPRQVSLLRDGVDVRVGVSQLVPEDLMLVRPGERLATDGVVVSGSSSLDLSAVTGESIPVEVGPGSPAYAAGVNGSGALTVRVTATANDSSLGQLVRVLSAAEADRSDEQTQVDRLAARLVPLALGSALALALFGVVTGDFSTWVYRGCMVMVAMSPCALVIAVPVTILSAVGAASQGGLVVKGGGTLERLALVRTAALDKTGTLTGVNPTVVEVVPVDGRASASDVVALAAGLEACSGHPLAGAIVQTASVDGFAIGHDVEAFPGQGLAGTVEGVPARVGSPGFVDPGPLRADVARLQDGGSTVVLVERAGGLLGAIAVRDELRPEAAEAVRALRVEGIGHVVMVTGDNRRAAQALGSACGVDEVHAELLPSDKLAVVRDLEATGPVLMVGDGINDAPALSAASVGVAIAALGTDVAEDAADVALMGHDLRRLPELIGHARSTQRIVRQGVIAGCAVMAALVPLAAAGAIPFAALVLVHEFSGVLIIGNGLRAGRARHVSPLPASAGPHGGRAATTTAAASTSKTAGGMPGRWAAATIAAVALVAGLGGGLYHTVRVSNTNRYPNWVKAAQPIFDAFEDIGYSYLKLGPDDGASPTFTMDCTGAAQAVEALVPRIPPLPPSEKMRDLLGTYLAHLRHEFGPACQAGDHAAMTAAASEATSARARLVATAIKKAGGHAH